MTVLISSRGSLLPVFLLDAGCNEHMWPLGVAKALNQRTSIYFHSHEETSYETLESNF